MNVLCTDLHYNLCFSKVDFLAETFDTYIKIVALRLM